jgi:DUF2934 family protein
MAKRTSRSEADDTTPAAVPTRQARGRARSALGPGGAANQETAPEMTESYAARSEPTDRAETDASTREAQSEWMHDEPSEEDIRCRAYELYLERGGGDGLDFDDWVRAKEELKNRK